MKKNSNLHFGTCSWKYDSWRGIIYPPTGKFNYLKEYSKHFDTVEIDQWFWSLFGEKVKLPSHKDVVDYTDSVHEDFKFTIKVPNSITLTHHYKKTKNDSLTPNLFFLSPELFSEFCDSIKYMHRKIGMLMFQFEYLNKQKISSLQEFLRKLEQFLNNVNRDLPIGIEIRNPNYLTSEFFDFLNTHNVYFVFLQGYYMPPIWEIYNKFSSKIIGKTVIRLHGPNREEIERETSGNWNQIIFPKDSELKQIIEVLRDLDKKKIDTYINVNNHYEGSAPLTIQKIKENL